MTAKLDYAALRNLGYAMTADVCAMLAEHLAIALTPVPELNGLMTYLSRTFQMIQIICHVQIVSSLFHLKALNKGFHNASRWYAVTLVTTVLIMALAGLLELVNSEFLPVSTVLLMTAYLVKLLVQAVGSRAVLLGAADLLSSFGLEKHAGKNRRAGVAVMISSVFFSLTLSAFCLLLLYLYFTVIDQNGVLSSDAVTQTKKCWLMILLLSIIPAVIFWVVSRLLTAVRMWRSYKEIKELTQ